MLSVVAAVWCVVRQPLGTGVADVQVVANSTAAGQVDRTKLKPLVVGSTPPLVFCLDSKDADGDTINDWKDNCPFSKNFNQRDSNADGRGNACQCLNVPNGTACATGCKTGETCSSGTCGGGSNKRTAAGAARGTRARRARPASLAPAAASRDIRAFSAVVDGWQVHYHVTGERGMPVFTASKDSPQQTPLPPLSAADSLLSRALTVLGSRMSASQVRDLISTSPSQQLSYRW